MTLTTRTVAAFAAVEFVEEVQDGVDAKVLGLVAYALKEASIRLNNEGLLLPAEQWIELRNQCDALDELSQAYARASLQKM